MVWELGCAACAALCALVLMPGEGGGGRGRPSGRLAPGLLAWLARPTRLAARSRSRGSPARLERELPELLDVVVLGLSAGLSFDASLSLYCGRYRSELSVSLQRAMRSWQMGLESRADALDGLARALGSPSLRRFAAAVSEAIAFGTPLVATLERQAEAIRDQQRSDTEERIEKAPVKMLLPLGTLVVPAMLLAILGPLLSFATRVA